MKRPVWVYEIDAEDVGSGCEVNTYWFHAITVHSEHDTTHGQLRIQWGRARNREFNSARIVYSDFSTKSVCAIAKLGKLPRNFTPSDAVSLLHARPAKLNPQTDRWEIQK